MSQNDDRGSNGVRASSDGRPIGVFIGLTVLDVVSQVSRYPTSNEKVTASAQLICAGGPAANAAVTFAALGGCAVLITAIGSSGPGMLARHDLETHGVTVIDLAPQDFSMAVSSITVTASTGDRSIVSMDGGTSQVVPDVDSDAFARAATFLADCNAVLVDGHHPELARAALRLVPAHVNVVVDAGRWKKQFEWILPLTTCVVASQDFDDPFGWVPHDANEVPGLAKLMVRTRGAGAVGWWSEGTSGEVTAQKVTAVDTSGAGDAFHGAFVFYAARTFQIAQQGASRWGVADLQSAHGLHSAHSGHDAGAWPAAGSQQANGLQSNPDARDIDVVSTIEFASSVASLKVQSFGTRSWFEGLNPSALWSGFTPNVMHVPAGKSGINESARET